MANVKKYLTENFVKLESVRSGPIAGLIIEARENNKFSGGPKLEIVLDDMSVLTLNATNLKTLAKAYGDETSAWYGKQVEFYLGEAPYKGEMVASVLVRPISSSDDNPLGLEDVSTAPIAAEPPPKANADIDDDIPF